MADATWLPPSSSDETIARLDSLFAHERSLKSEWLARLAATVSGLSSPVEEEPEPESPSRTPLAQETSRPAPAESGWVILPKRTTHGGPYGASIIDRVAASVRKDSDW